MNTLYREDVTNELKGKNFLSLKDFSKEEIHTLLDLAIYLKKRYKQGLIDHPLKGKTLAMIFEKASTRTRVSFEVGMYQLGGSALFLSKNDIQLSRGESISDTANVLSSYVDGIMIRTFDQGTIDALATHASIPVINGLTDLYHPCQVLADLLTIKERKGTLNGMNIAYIGDGNNMAHSLMIGCAKVGANITVASPNGYEPLNSITEFAQTIAKQENSSVEITNSTLHAAMEADVIYTDVWASMGQEEEQIERELAFRPFQVNENIMNEAKKDAIFMHCLPAHRGEEVSTDVIDGEQSVIFQQSENRLHAQKALLTAIMGELE